MRRETSTPRPDWQSIVSSQGLTFHTPDGHPYWDESVCYCFRSSEIDQIEAALQVVARSMTQATTNAMPICIFPWPQSPS